MRTPDPAVPPVLARDALAELGRISFDGISMEDLLRRVADLSQQVIPGVAEASVTVIAGDRAMTAAHTGPLALVLDESQIGQGYGPCLDAAVGQEIQEITDARAETCWPEYTPVCVEHGALSSLSVPVPVRGTVQGALNLYGLETFAFDDACRATGSEFASYVSVALGNMHLYVTARELAEHLDTAMRSRAVIEQAKGILMSQRHCDAAEAFSMLAAASQRSNRKVRDIAQAIVDGATAPPAARG